MVYDGNSKIESVENVVKFFQHLAYEKKLSFHPDDDFKEYVYYTDQRPFFTDEEVPIYNKLMDQCFDVCQKNNADIYGIGLDVLRGFMGGELNKNN